MNPDPVYERLRDIGWRRPLTEAEQVELGQWLAAHPEHPLDGEAEAALTRALARLPNAPISSNFTSRVMQAISQEEQITERARRQTRGSRWQLIPRIAIATVVVGITGFSYWHYQGVKQEQLVDAARNLMTVTGAGPLSDPTVLENFEVIRRMSQADDGLLALSDDLLSLKQ